MHIRIRRAREEMGYTREQFAEKLFVSRTAVSKWESGRGYPNIDSLKAIAKYFDSDFDPANLGEYAGIAQQYLFYYERYLQQNQ